MQKIFASYISDKLFVSRIYKEFSTLRGKKKTTKNPPNPVRKWVKDLIRNFTSGDVWKSISTEEMSKIISYQGNAN